MIFSFFRFLFRFQRIFSVIYTAFLPPFCSAFGGILIFFRCCFRFRNFRSVFCGILEFFGVVFRFLECFWRSVFGRVCSVFIFAVLGCFFCVFLLLFSFRFFVLFEVFSFVFSRPSKSAEMQRGKRFAIF